ncbi:MAG: hypothetical protein ACTS68_01600 [Candidatus Hodgkinia cicadicola]
MFTPFPPLFLLLISLTYARALSLSPSLVCSFPFYVLYENEKREIYHERINNVIRWFQYVRPGRIMAGGCAFITTLGKAIATAHVTKLGWGGVKDLF